MAYIAMFSPDGVVFRFCSTTCIAIILRCRCR
ncbi:MAG: hypothetical protein GXY32_03180 [Ruminococcaceae bacterium]|nr:hypothetical protein [Oscillospiraceae bacterium]